MEEQAPPISSKPHPRDFFLAIRHWDANEVKRLLAEGADPNWKNRRGDETALAFAARVSTADVVQVLLEHGATDDGPDPLINAVYWDRMDGNPDTAAIARLLLQYEADVNLATETGHTPLIEAVIAGDLATIDLLLQQGADIDAVWPPDQAVLSLVVSNNVPEVIALLQKARAQNEL